MGENLMVGTHKVSIKEFCDNYENMVWDHDPEDVKEEKRKRISREYKRDMNRENR